MTAFTGTLSIKSLLLVKTKLKSDALLVSLPQVSSFTCCSKKQFLKHSINLKFVSLLLEV